MEAGRQYVDRLPRSVAGTKRYGFGDAVELLFIEPLLLELDFIVELFAPDFIDDPLVEPVAGAAFCDAAAPAAVGFFPPAAVELPAEVVPVA